MSLNCYATRQHANFHPTSILQIITEKLKDFRRYTTKYLGTDMNSCPTFNLETCTKYFKNIWRRICPGHVFVIPNWLPNLLALNMNSKHYLLRILRKQE